MKPPGFREGRKRKAKKNLGARDNGGIREETY